MEGLVDLDTSVTVQPMPKAVIAVIVVINTETVITTSHAAFKRATTRPM